MRLDEIDTGNDFSIDLQTAIAGFYAEMVTSPTGTKTLYVDMNDKNEFETLSDKLRDVADKHGYLTSFNGSMHYSNPLRLKASFTDRAEMAELFS